MPPPYRVASPSCRRLSPRLRAGGPPQLREQLAPSAEQRSEQPRNRLVHWHPHLHLLTTDGGKTTDGPWKPLPEWDGLLLMRLFRERLLARLVEAHAI